MAIIPDPLTTEWVPLHTQHSVIGPAGPQGVAGPQGPQGPAGQGADLTYHGDYVAATYNDGDIVVINNISYMCVKDGTTTPPEPWPGGNTGQSAPSLHASTHITGGTDPLTLGQDQITGLTTALNSHTSSISTINANAAMKNAANVFTADQIIQKTTPIIALIDNAAAAGKKNFHIINNNANFKIRAMSDDGLTVNKDLLWLDRTASTVIMQNNGLVSGGYFKVMSGGVNSFIQSDGPIYPGRVDTGWTEQASWWLGTHGGTVGLYTNTNFYAEGNLSSSGNVTGANVISNSTINALHGYNTRPGQQAAWGGNYFNFNWTGTVQCWIDASNIGTIAMTSDSRIKRDFTPLVNSLEKVLQMKPGTFYYKLLGAHMTEDPDMHLGLQAQDVMPFAPELVRNTKMVTPYTPDGVLQVNYIELISMLVAAIQELNAKIL